MPKVSVITPAYVDTIDKMDWFGEAVQSVMKQTLTDWELIIVDDASPTRLTVEVPDERVRIFRMVYRVGPALCRNTAAALARANALLPLDADDILVPDALERLYNVWQANPNKIIYGDLQRLEKIAGQYQPGRIFGLPEYTFEKALDPNGIMPVTAMHSVECHQKAGGWKPAIEAGLEDVEYWIAAGKAGFCGQRIPEVTLLWRRHEESRSNQLRHGNKRESEMRNLIKELHRDVYEGRYPMGCCGGGRAIVPLPTNQKASAAPVALANVPVSQKIWVEYKGAREGKFGIVGAFTNHAYIIHGPGHKIEVHLNDLSKFQRAGRGKDFVIGVQAPNDAPPPVEITQTSFQAQPPELAQVERLDKIAAGVQ